jgi:branched-chain amino acid transport system substrate-binding protein
MASTSRRLTAAALAGGAALALSALTGAPAKAADKGPINIGVIAPFSAIDGASIINGAEMAVDDINAHGGIMGRQIKLFKYDNHKSATEGVRAFQRAVNQDHVVAMIGIWISEIALAMEPWSGRLKTPFIITGAASTQIPKHVHDDYNTYKYTFHDWLNSAFLADAVCDSSNDLLVKPLGYKTAYVMSEDAAWTKPLDDEYLKCLPKSGLKVVGHTRFSPDTTDFTPIFNKIEAAKPDVIITGIAHVGLKPTVQWHDQQVPMLMAGVSAQAGASTFWKRTNGATEGIVTTSAAVKGAALTPKTIPFTNAYTKRFNTTPAYNAYTTDDAFYFLKAAIERAKSTNADKVVAQLEKTDYVGNIGRVQFYNRKEQYTHGLKYGKKYITGVALQWQHGDQVALWPDSVAKAKVILPSWIKNAKQHASK